MTIKNMFKKDDVFLIDEAEEFIKSATDSREEIRAEFNKLENPTKKQQAMYDLAMGMTYEMKRLMKDYIEEIRQ